MRTRVTNEGVLIPRELLGDAEEVVIRAEKGRLIIIPVHHDDPVFEFGKSPVPCGAPRASADHDDDFGGGG